MAVTAASRFLITKTCHARPWDTAYNTPLRWVIYLVHADGTQSYITRYCSWQEALAHVNTALQKFGRR